LEQTGGWAENKKRQQIKCVVWDLDGTIWDGVLIEDINVKLKQGIVDIIKGLDERGILQSVASKNDSDNGMKKLRDFRIDQYFIYPMINWNPKSESIKEIARLINIGLDTIAFIDDQAFEREEVNFGLKEVMCIDSQDVSSILDMPEMMPRFITEDSKIRRLMYMSDIKRKEDEEVFVGTNEEFLASLGMELTISRVKEEDLKRAEELTVRTHQLNTTGYTYSYEELDELRKSDQHMVLTAELKDKYGTYGKIGLVLIETKSDVWTIKLLIMSCRIMSRGIGSILINHILSLAKAKGVRLLAEFVSTDRNRMMYITYAFSGFKQIKEDGDFIVFENDFSNIIGFPDYVKVNIL